MRRGAKVAWLGVALVAAVALLWWTRSQVEVEGSGGTAHRAPMVTPAVGAAAAAADELATPAARSEVVEAPGPPSSVSVALRGRCLAAEDGRPLQGVAVEASPMQGNKWRQPGATDAEGRFAIAIPAEAFELVVAQRGRLRLSETWLTAPAAAASLDVGDLKMPAAFPVRGLVVDQSGAAVANANVSVLAPMYYIGDLMTSGGSWGNTGADGAFTLERELPAGRYNARVVTREVAGSCEFAVDAVRGAEPLRIVVVAQKRRALEGVVVDDLGVPVAGVTLASPKYELSYSDANGHFLCEQLGEDGRDEVVLTVYDPGRCEPAPPQHLRWGDRDCRIVLRRAQRLAVDVVDDAGAPVTRFSVWLGQPPPGIFDGDFRCGGEHEGGHAVVEPARRGRNLLRVLPDDRDLALSQPQEVMVGDVEPPPVCVVLERLRPCQIEVVDAAGAAVADAKLELVRLGSAGVSVRAWSPREKRAWSPGLADPELLDGATTGADGRAELRSLATTALLQLRVDQERFPPAAIAAPALSPASPLRVVLSSPGSIAGHVDSRSEPDAHFTVELTSPDRSTWVAKVDRDGSFHFDRLRAGSHRLKLGRYSEVSRRAVFSQYLLAIAERTADVREGATTEVDFGAPPRTGRVHGRVRLQNLELTDLRVTARLIDSEAQRGEFAVGVDGSFVADGIPPGRWRFLLWAKSLSRPHEFADELEVNSDCDLDHEFVLAHRRLVLQLRHPDGSAAKDCFLRIGGRDESCTGPEVVLDPAPVLPLQVRVAAENSEWSSPYTLPAGGDEVTATLTVPAPK